MIQSRQHDIDLLPTTMHCGRGTWRHPLDPSLRVPRKTAATIAVMEMGVHDYAKIAGAVGLTVEQVEQIDAAEDHAVRRIATAGIPRDVYFALRKNLRCPKCYASITIAPCVACKCREAEFRRRFP